MSDSQTGPDWWLASDGRWYPPQSLPAPPQPPTASAVPRVNIAYSASPEIGLSTTLNGWLILLFVSTAAAAIAHAVLGFVTLDAFNGYRKSTFEIEAERRLETWLSAEKAMNVAAEVFAIVALATIVLLVTWTFKAHRASQQLWTGRRRWSIGWTIGGWFIPAAQLVLPKLILNEIERIAAAPRSKPGQPIPLSGGRTAISGWIWWVLTVVGAVTGRVGLTSASRPEFSENEVRIAYILSSAGSICMACGLLAGAFYARRICRRLSPSGLQLIP